MRDKHIHAFLMILQHGHLNRGQTIVVKELISLIVVKVILELPVISFKRKAMQIADPERRDNLLREALQRFVAV